MKSRELNSISPEMKNQLYPCLWFDGQANVAAAYYCSIFPNSKIISANPMVVNFELIGTKIMGLNGGPQYKFSPATSFVIECETQEEIDGETRRRRKV